MKKYFIFFVIAWIIFVSHAILTKHAIYGDGNGYYTYTQALFYDKSLNFTKVYNFLEHFQGRTGEFSRLFWDKSFNPYSIGTGIIWLPSLFLTNSFSSNRFDLVNELGPGLTGIVCMIAGLYFIEKYLLKYFSKNTVFWTILILFFGSNVLYYTAFEPALSHQPAFLIISILLYLSSDSKRANLFLVGVLSGLLLSVRLGDAVFLIPIFYAFRKRGSALLYIPLGAFLAYTPQLLNQKMQFNNFVNNPYLSGQNGGWQINLLNIFKVLFSYKKGLFVWTPVFALATYGLIGNKKYTFLVSLAGGLLSASFWPGGLSAGFGIRLMFSGIPYFAVGIAHVVNKMKIKSVRKLFAASSVYNFLLLVIFFIFRWKDLA